MINGSNSYVPADQKVAVLIPCFKPKNYIIRCFESLEAQSLDREKFKVYICLNGDRYPFERFLQDLLAQCSFRYRLMYLPVANVSLARNMLIDCSSENYIVFIDDDDFVSPCYLKELLNCTGQQVMGIANTYSVEESSSALKDNFMTSSFFKLNDVETSFLRSRKYFSSPWAKMIHRDMLGSIRFDRNVSKGEDSLFFSQLTENIKFIRKTGPEVCYFVNERVGSLTRNKITILGELKTLNYLIRKYFELLFTGRYNTLFMFTRIVATFRKYYTLFRYILRETVAKLV